MMKLIKNIFAISVAFYGIHGQAQVINPLPLVNDQWRFSGTIAGWVPASWTTTTVRNRSVTTDATINQNVTSAGGLAMFSLEGHKGRFGLMGDLVYWQLKGSNSLTRYTPGDNASIYGGYNGQVSQTMLTMAGTYTAYQSPSVYLDGLLGARYITSTTTIAANFRLDAAGRSTSLSGYPSVRNQTTDPVIGFKGRARIMDSSWFIPFYADAGKGSGSNNGTWQTMVGVGNAYSWGDVALTYRAMGFHLKGTDVNNNFTNAGPQLSATINF